MKEFKGTKGEWYIQEMNGDFWVKSDSNDVVHYGTDIMCDDFGEHNGYPEAQRMADAKLIAAAPELLNVLIRIKEEHGISDPDIEEEMNKTLKKALG